jgi:acyl dehydratase
MTEFYEDIGVGDGWETGAYEMTRDEMLGFARRYDPQPMHTDEEAAAETFFGGLVASGWHTAAVSMRLVVQDALEGFAVVGATGVDALRWREPVRAGDVLRVRGEVVGKEAWDGERGAVRYEQETVREGDDAVVMSLTANVLFERR